MSRTTIVFPKSISSNSGQIKLNDEALKNVINVDGDDYVLGYLDEENPGNKGGNSCVFLLYNLDDFDESYGESPDFVIKISKFDNATRKTNRIERFDNEINALVECKENNCENVVNVYKFGDANINVSAKRIKAFKFYIMEYADFDLTKYIQNNKLSLYKKVNLCLDISNGLSQLNKLGYYHRDLKPDNILMSDSTWKIADLGLISSRTVDLGIDQIGEFIGPRGWYSPEALNKALTEGTDFEECFDCKIDHKSDIFQLGKLFWYIFQGNCPVGNIKPVDFKIRDREIYAILKTMLNHSKERRYDDIDNVSKLLKPIHDLYYKKDIA